MYKKRILSDTKGMTLVELIVSMAIFSTVIGLMVGFLIMMQRLQMTYRDAANLQQEGRTASEIFSRFVREAKTISGTFETVNGLCDGDVFTITMVDDTSHSFTCDGILKMDGIEITSSQINVRQLLIYNSGDPVYPKTIRYKMQVEKLNPQTNQPYISSPSPGDFMVFLGYLVMRNEL